MTSPGLPEYTVGLAIAGGLWVLGRLVAFVARRWPRRSGSCWDSIREMERREMASGVDLPRWRTPKELKAMRKAERQSATRDQLRVVGRAGR